MADISRITALDGVTYNLKDQQARLTMAGATDQINGTPGAVPKPVAGDQNKLLQGDGTWTDTINVGRKANTAVGRNSTAEGSNTTASGAYSHAEGYFTTANQKSQHVFGEYNAEDPSSASTSERGNYVEIVGNGTGDSARSNARTLDWDGNEWIAGDLTINGASNTPISVSTLGSSMVGATSSANGAKGLVPAPAAGDQNKILQGNGTWSDSISIGRKADTTIGYRSTAEGLGTTASADGAHSEGTNTIASGYCSHTEGSWTVASAQHSHAEGSGSQASGIGAHAEGVIALAEGEGSHAEGDEANAEGHAAHAEGYNSYAKGDYSHAEGCHTYAKHRSQHVFGEYNKLDTSSAEATDRGNYVEIVGNGTGTSDSARSNARTLDWDGNEVLAGDLKINTNVSVANRILGVENTISIPSPSSSTYYLLDGLTSDHIVVAWNFSSSSENLPPCNLTITTYYGYFMVTNDGGTTTETIKPVFARPKYLTVEQSDTVPVLDPGTLVPREGE